MPYLPPADLPPPPIVQTVPMPVAEADVIEPQAISEHGDQRRSQAQGKERSPTPHHHTPIPEAVRPAAQFASDPSPVSADQVAPPRQSATRAELLRSHPPSPATNATVSATPEPEPTRHRPAPLHRLPSLAIPWLSQRRDRPNSPPADTIGNPDESPADSPVFEPLILPDVDDRTPDEEDAVENDVEEDAVNEEADDEAVENNADDNDADADDADIENASDDDADENAVDDDDEAENADADDADDDEADDDEADAIIYPRAATPEADWSNGAVVDGVLLTPTQPTNRPPTPLDLTADYQDFQTQSQVLTARGDVVLRLRDGVLRADQLWANLANRFVIVEGDVIFTRGEQTVEADRGEYNLLQGSGTLFDARGTLYLPRVGNDFAVLTGEETTNPGILETDPISNVQGTSSITFGTGVTAPTSVTGLPIPAFGGAVRRFRFEAAQLDFDSEGWYAQDIGLTNDPFSPPELVFRGDSATLTRLTEFQDELYVENARLVFDQRLTVPLLRDRVLINRGGPDSANPLFVTLAFDGNDRDGLFAERSFRVFNSGTWRASLTPQFLIQRAVNGEATPPPETSFLSNFGLVADVTGLLSPTTGVDATASFSGLDFENLENRLRSSIRVRQLLGDHTLNLEYSYRDRLFNGSLGFQNVQSNFGLVLVSPNIAIGDTGIVVNYQASAQYINANTDRLELLDDLTPPFRVSLGRFQGSVGIGRGFTLWRGEALPATAEEGLRYTAVPRVPNITLSVSGRGTYTYYTSNDTQDDLAASVSLFGELGHFSDNFFDSTVFNLTYSRSFVSDAATSPFLFDRNVDNTTLSGGIIQQIYGPFRLGFQTSYNLETGQVINTDYVLEYNRRTYGFFLRYNPTQESGFLGFRLNEFDWAGRAARFGGADIGQVEGGVVRPNQR